MKDLHTEEIWSGRYAVDVYKLRSIKPSPRAIAEYSTARTKSLEIAVFPTVRSMRAVFHEVLPARRTPLSSPQFSRID
jgi:hypothetical protein